MSAVGALFWSFLIAGTIPLVSVVVGLLGTPLGHCGGSRATQRCCRFHLCRDRGVVRRSAWLYRDHRLGAVCRSANQCRKGSKSSRVTFSEMPKRLLPKTSAKSWKLTCIPMSGLLLKKSGWRWPKANRAPKPGSAYNRLWQTYYRFRPQNEDERVWYAQSLARMNQLGDQRRLRLLSSQSGGIPAVMWIVLLGAGAITIGFTFLFGTKNAVAQAVMTGGLAMIIALVLLSVVALEHPFAGLTRIEPEAFNQTKDIFDTWSKPGVGQPR